MAQVAPPPIDVDEVVIPVEPGTTPGDWPDEFDIVGVEHDAEFDYFILRRRNA